MPPRYDQATFRATHNSFSRKQGKSVAEQLDRGVRCVELDVHAGDHGRDFGIGHLWIGDDVATGNGNPDDCALTSWLETISDWSARNPRHAPITLVIDMKSDLTRRRSFSAGNLAALNHTLLASLGGARVYRAEAVADSAWPPLEEVRDHVIVVLSGDFDGRLGYLRDGGLEPAVAIGEGGIAVELHGSQRREIWYWSGRFDGSRIEWACHGAQAGLQVQECRTPAVCIGLGGEIVGVSVRGQRAIECRVGHLDQETLEIEWGAGQIVPVTDPGPEPLPRVWVDGDEFRLVYESEGGPLTSAGRLRADGTRVEWDQGGPPSPDDAAHRKDRAMHDGHTVRVKSQPLPDGQGGILRYQTDNQADAGIRYQQIAFVEVKWGDRLSPDDARYFAKKTEAAHIDWAKDASAHGKLVRLWDYDDSAFRPGFKPNFAATNHPFADWYDRYCRDCGAVDT